jgi:hypothetical protein
MAFAEESKHQVIRDNTSVAMNEAYKAGRSRADMDALEVISRSRSGTYTIII